MIDDAAIHAICITGGIILAVFLLFCLLDALRAYSIGRAVYSARPWCLENRRLWKALRRRNIWRGAACVAVALAFFMSLLFTCGTVADWEIRTAYQRMIKGVGR